MITEEQLKSALPSKLRTFASRELADKINKITTDPEYAENIKENFLAYTNVLQEGRYKLDDYLNAVAYVSFKLMGYTNEEAYFRTFPDRYALLKAQGKTSRDISPYVAAYHRGKLVNKIMEQSLIPSWILNQDAYQEAINKNVQLMRTAKSEKVQAMAADSLLKHLAKPEVNDAPMINIDMRQGSGLDELRSAITSLAKKQKELIEGGVSTKEIAEQKLYAEVVND